MPTLNIKMSARDAFARAYGILVQHYGRSHSHTVNALIQLTLCEEFFKQ